MKEKKRTVKENNGGGDDGLSLGVGLDLPESKIVHVASGPYAEDLPVAGMTVGAIRMKFKDHFDINDQAQGTVNGTTVGDDIRTKANDSLMFIHHAGEKGAKNNQVVIEGVQATVHTPEGQTCSMGVGPLLECCAPGLSTGGILPHGVRAVLSRGPITLWFWEKPPCIQRLSWIREDSPAPYGSRATYRNVTIALPYLVIMAVFQRGEMGLPALTLADECFFRTKPLTSMNDELLFPGLLNCSKYEPQSESNPLSWICTQHLKPNDQMESKDPGKRFAGGFEAVRYCLLETSFNLSSERHEGNSWYGASKKIDKRISTIGDWEENTKKDPLFVLDVPWIPTKHTVKSLAERTFNRLGQQQGEINSSEHLSRIIINSNGAEDFECDLDEEDNDE